MDQYRLANRSFLPMSHLYRINFIEEELPREEELKPINYRDQILSFSSICFIIMPIELSFIPLPIRNRSNMINTLLISNYILKSIEVIIFEPALVIFIVFRFMENNIDGPYVTAIFILVIVDMGKYVLLNVYLIIFSSIGRRNKVSLWLYIILIWILTITHEYAIDPKTTALPSSSTPKRRTTSQKYIVQLPKEYEDEHNWLTLSNKRTRSFTILLLLSQSKRSH